jgi:hypothetical protein
VKRAPKYRQPGSKISDLTTELLPV